MQKSDLHRLIVEYRNISGEEIPVIVGSQSIHAITELLPEIARRSIECDFLLSVSHFDKRSEIDEKLGVFSEFQQLNGIYADALGLATVVLPDGWQDRLVPLLDGTGKVIAFCMEIYDVASSKFVAGRGKDLEFLEAILNLELIQIGDFLSRLDLVKSKVENDVISERLRRLGNHLSRSDIHIEVVDAIKKYELQQP